MLADEGHVGRGEEVKGHDGRNVPEIELIVQPEVPVDGYLHHQVHARPQVVHRQAGYVVEACHDEPRGVDAHQSSCVKMPVGGVLHPREPQSHATEEEEHIHADVTHAAQAKEQVGACQLHMEEHDEEHGGAHQLAAVTTDVLQFDVGYSHGRLMFRGVTSVAWVSSSSRGV